MFTIDTHKPLTLHKAKLLRDHFQFLLNKPYDKANPELGTIEALVIIPYGQKDEFTAEFMERKVKQINGSIFESPNFRSDKYEVILMARIGHQHMKQSFTIFKEISQYAQEQDLQHIMQGFM